MEENKNMSTTTPTVEIPQLNPESISFLLKAAKWAKFLSILGFIVTGLMIVAAITMSFVLNMVSEEMIPLNMPFSPKILSVLYVIIAGIFVIPVVFLNTFSNNAIKAVNLCSTEKMTLSLRNLKNLFVFFGLATIIILALYLIILIVVGTAAFVSL